MDAAGTVTDTKLIVALLPGAGTYGGVNVNAGRVTYTASMP
jgi:hypothetical protein